MPSVGILVVNQVGALAEAPPALPTLVEPFPGVQALVADEVRVVPEALHTFPTPVGLLSLVNYLMVG